MVLAKKITLPIALIILIFSAFEVYYLTSTNDGKEQINPRKKEISKLNANLGWEKLYNRDWKKADDSFSQSLKINPIQSTANHGKGELSLLQSDFNKATSFFKTAYGNALDEKLRSALNDRIEFASHYNLLKSSPNEWRLSQRLMVKIDAGMFPMLDQKSGPRKRKPYNVFLDSFKIDKYETTWLEYQECKQAKACQGGRKLSNTNGEYDYLFPVEVTWDQAREYCNWRGKRLPTLAEWHKSLGLDLGTSYEVLKIPQDISGWYNIEPPYLKHTHLSKIRGRPAGQTVPNRREIYNMLGNVAEWVDESSMSFMPIDISKVYRNPKSPKLDNVEKRIICGGNDNFNDERAYTPVFRIGCRSKKQNKLNGIRCVASILGSEEKGKLNQAGYQFSSDDFVKAINRNELELVQVFINAGIDLNLKDQLGNLPLSVAIQNDNAEITKLLTKNGAKLIEVLSSACKSGDLGLAKKSISLGANINSKDSDGFTPLVLTIKYKHLDVFNHLISKSGDVNLKSKGYFECGRGIPIECAVIRGDYDMVKTLIYSGADFAADPHRIFQKAVISGNLKIIKLLVQKGIDPKFIDKSGNSYLFYAIKSDNNITKDELIDYFIKQGVDINKTNKVGQTALFVEDSRIRYGRLILISRGAKINVVDNKGNTPLMVSSHWAILPEVQAMIDKGADLHTLNQKGENALWKALTQIRRPKAVKSVVKLLLEKKSDASIIVDNGQTPLHKAVRDFRDLELVRLLVDYGAKPNMVNHMGESPLWHAVATGNSDVVKYLLLKGADPNLYKHPAESPLERAKILGDMEIHKLLVQAGAK